MEYKIPVGISNKHVHLTKETYDALFDEPLEKVKDLNQIGEFASNQFVDLKTEKNTIEHVRIVGPFRTYNQVEICNSDAYFLGINPPVRKSGDLNNSESISVIGPKGQIDLTNACIIAQRHVHMNTKDLESFHLKDNDFVKIKIDGPRSAILDANIKASNNGYLELHIDRDEANALLLQGKEKVTLITESEEKMLFKGFEIKVSCAAWEQVEVLGNFWDKAATMVKIEKLVGLGYNWENNYFSYAIGFIDQFDELEKLRDLDAKYVEIELPKNGWITKKGKIEELQQIYEQEFDCYNQKFKYEIERFDQEDNCEISVLL